MFIRQTLCVSLLGTLTLASACRSPNSAAPSTQAAVATALAPQSTPLVTDEPQRNIMTLAKWSPRGDHQWEVMPACAKGQRQVGEVGRVQSIAEDYLIRKNLLPAKFHFCISKLDTDTWQATCVPAREYLNSPVTLIISANHVQDHYYSEAADPVEMGGDDTPPQLPLTDGPVIRPGSEPDPEGPTP